MSRIRTLKPQIVEDEKVAPLSDAAHRLFISMIVLSDDQGNVRADVRWLQRTIWWAHESPPNVLPLLLELCRAPLIEVYAVRGGTYAHLRGWQKHQRIDNAGKPRVPAQNDPQAEPWEADGQGFSANPAKTQGEESAGQQFAATLRESPRDSAKFRSDLDLDQEEEGECARARDPVATPRPPKPSGSRIRISPEWVPSDDGTRRAMALELDVAREAEKFRQHFKSTGQRLVDWDAAFLKWLERSREYSDERRKPGEEAREIRDL